MPLQADDPASKLYQVKEALYTVLGSSEGIQFGFASFNQDALKARGKHWRYQATTAGLNIPGWGAFPALGERETFGLLWSCDTGSSDSEIGCYANTPADLPDGWERSRVAVLPKLGSQFNQAVTFFVRSLGVVYRVKDTPLAGATPGLAVTVTEQISRCNNASCSATTNLGQSNLGFSPVDEFLSWDLGGTSSQTRTDPEMTFFTASAATDSAASNNCAGWDPNTDAAADPFSGYDLRWPTTVDGRGSELDLGDVIPLDWATTHVDDLRDRLAPNRIGNPGATPDFRTSPYLQNLPVGTDTFLRLKDEDQRPLFAVGSTPHGNALESFREWYSGCSAGLCSGGWSAVAAAQDPDWTCRRVALLVLTDGDDSCESADPCSQANDLFTLYGIPTYVAGFGLDAATLPPTSKLQCMASDGGTTAPYLSHTRQGLEDDLNAILSAISSGS